MSPPILEGLDLRNSSSYALNLAGITSPLVFDSSMAIDVTGSHTGIYLGLCVGLTLRDLDLETYGVGLFIATGQARGGPQPELRQLEQAAVDGLAGSA